MYGIFNGTCNYILTQMTGAGQAYDEALADAQRLGYAEADPTLDVTGGDTMHKLVILASLAFGAQVAEDHVPCEGIDRLHLADIQFGIEMGYQIKLLAIAERTSAGLALSVGPCFVHRDEPIAQVRGSFNAMSLYGHAVGHTFYYGRGAGQMPTASAVVGDLLNLASGSFGALFAAARTWPDQQAPPDLADPDEVQTRYYMRVNALDRPGVLARVSDVLGRHDVSIAAVNQHEQNTGEFVPLVVITHDTAAGALRRAADEIAGLDVIEGQPVCIRIIDMPEG
jgi:homoserine dehydrogenase